MDDSEVHDDSDEEEDVSPLTLKGVASLLAGQQRLEYLFIFDLSVLQFLEGPSLEAAR